MLFLGNYVGSLVIYLHGKNVTLTFSSLRNVEHFCLVCIKKLRPLDGSLKKHFIDNPSLGLYRLVHCKLYGYSFRWSFLELASRILFLQERSLRSLMDVNLLYNQRFVLELLVFLFWVRYLFQRYLLFWGRIDPLSLLLGLAQNSLFSYLVYTLQSWVIDWCKLTLHPRTLLHPISPSPLR